MVTLGLLALGLASARRCEGASEGWEPLADHLPPAIYTADHQAWLQAVMEELPALTEQLAALPGGSEPSKVAALQTRIAMLQGERQDLEAHRHLWQSYRQTTDSTVPSLVQGGKPTPALDRQTLLELCHAYLNGAEFIEAVAVDEAHERSATESTSSSRTQGVALTPTLVSHVAPSADQWEYLAGRFERLLRTAQTTEGADGALALYGRLLQGSCYLSASVEHFKAKQRREQLRAYAAQGPDVSGKTTVAWNRQQINVPTTKQQTLIETQGKGSCTLAFQFH